MIERYTIKLVPTVSQKDLGKALNDPTIHEEDAEKMKTRIELFGDG